MRSQAKKAKLIHSRKLVIPEDFEPRLPNDYDEMFVNGYFHCQLSCGLESKGL